MPGVVDDDRGLGVGAVGLAAGVVHRCRRRGDGRRGQVVHFDGHDGEAPHAAVAADEVRHERRLRTSQDLGRRVVLLEDPTLRQHGDAVAELGGLFDVVGHEHDRLAKRPLQVEELVLQSLAGDGVDGGERLVHEQNGGIGPEGACHAHPLALPPGQLVGEPAGVELRIEADQLEQLVDPVLDPGAVPAAAGGGRRQRCRRRDGAGRAHPAGSRSRCSRRIITGSLSSTFSPAMRMRPEVGSMSRLIIRKVVVLPHPDGPTSTASSPVVDLQAELRHRHVAVAIALRDPIQRDHVSHTIASGPCGFARGFRAWPGYGAPVIAAQPLFQWSYVTGQWSQISSDLLQHISLSLWPLGIGLVHVPAAGPGGVALPAPAAAGRSASPARCTSSRRWRSSPSSGPSPGTWRRTPRPRSPWLATRCSS